MACAVSYADDSNPCPCANGTQPYTIDCDGDGTPEKCAGEKCCNSDAGNHQRVSVNHRDSFSFSFLDLAWDTECGVFSVHVLKASGAGVARGSGMSPYSCSYSGTGTGSALNGQVTAEIKAQGTYLAHNYIACGGKDCGDWKKGATDELNYNLKSKIVANLICITYTSNWIDQGDYETYYGDAHEWQECK